jgi:hypothetical protein
MQFVQRYGKRIRIGLTLGAGMVLMATALRPQMQNGVPAVGPVWEYATITGSDANSRLCYADTGGCRTDNPSGASLMALAAKLGEKGWELAAATESNDNRRDRTLYFKRLKSVINRQESR